MEAADAASLVAAGTGDVVEPPLEAAERADVLQGGSIARRLLQRSDHIAFAEEGIAPLAFAEAEFRQHARRRKADRRRRNRALGQEFFGDQDRAAVKLGKMRGIEQPCLEV